MQSNDSPQPQNNLQPHEQPPERPSQQQLALIIRAFWSALIKPRWSKDDLIDLGKAVFAKRPLASLDEDLFKRIFPHLQEIGQELYQLQTTPPTPPTSQKENDGG